MSKATIIILILFFISARLVGNENDTLIMWSEDYKLKWSDFRGNPDPEYATLPDYQQTKAISNIGTTSKYELNGNIFTFKVEVYFNRYKSWTVLKTDQLLEHEQIHFDIAELYRRKIIRVFDSLKLDGVVDFDIYDSLFYKMRQEYLLTQQQYDFETGGGTFNKIQNDWKVDIEAELRRYSVDKRGND